MFTPNDIENRIRDWETQTTEFKRECSPDPIKETITAFANDYNGVGGGTLIIGVDPGTRTITGLQGDPEDTMRRITGLCRDTIVPTVAPQIYHLDVFGKVVVIVDVKTSKRRPHRANNICYIRVGPTTRKAAPDEEFELVRRSGQFPYDLMPIREAALEDLNLLKFEQEFLPKRLSLEILSSSQRSTLEWAEYLRFLVREGDRLVPTVAAILLFGRNPQYFVPHSSIDFIRFEGEDPSHPIVDRKEITGTIDELIKVAMEIVERHMIQGYQFSRRSPIRSDVSEYPQRAVREAVANAVMHRDYEVARVGVSIKLFDDRLEIISPGGLYGIVTRDNFGTGVNDYRNPTLAVNLNLLGLVEKAGTGIYMIRQRMRENGSLDPSFEIGDRYLLVRLPSHPNYLGVRLYQKGLVALERGDQDGALNLFKKSSGIIPHFAEVWAGLGRLEGLYGSIEESRKAFQRAIAENSSFEKAYLEWGRVEDQVGNTERSQEIFRQGTQAIPNSAALWQSRALLEQKLKDWRKAAAFLQKAVSLQPEDSRLLRSLGNVTFRLREFDRASDSFRRALQYTVGEQEKSRIYFDLMKVLVEQDANLAEVKECFDFAYLNGFRPQELFINYHRFLTSRGSHAEALEVLELARKEGINISPALPDLYIGGLPHNITKEKLIRELKALFRNENVDTTKIYIHPTRRFGFVTVASEEDASKAIKVLNNALFLGKKISIDRNKKR